MRYAPPPSLMSFAPLRRGAPFLVATLLAAPVHAQTVDLPGAPGTIARVDPSGKEVGKRPQANFPDAVSYSDCAQDLRLRIPLVLSGFDTSVSLQVWAGGKGTDCAQLTNRSGAARQCWRVTAADVARQQTAEALLRVRDILAQRQATSDQYVNATAEICGQVDETTFTVHFLWVRGGGDVAGSKTLDVVSDTIGPPALSGVSVSPGDTRLGVSWSSVGEAGATNTSQVTVYYARAGTSSGTTTTTVVCDDAGASSTTDDAGDGESDATASSSDAGCRTVTTTTPAGACAAPGFTKGKPPDDTVQRTTVGAFGSSATISGLENGVTYAVAVAATDPYLNVGEVSDLTCQTPVELDDFFERYRRAGGQAGGGYCALEGAGMPGGCGAFVVGVAGVMVGLLRRRRRRTSR